ncbi:MAG: Phage portal protein, lambda family [Planctomycetes bacterium ADurb.Bin412]|nr:MAG: Phage portal protein, lambda family [Planctomycetes bacterium ADurb.Bin412]
MFGWLRKKKTEYNRSEKPRRSGKRYYEATASDRHLEKTWEKATLGDADASLVSYLPKLRDRCRYEMRNNGYARGIVETLANDIIGSGPRIQFTTESDAFNQEAEEKFSRWAADCDMTGRMSLDELMRLAVSQLCECGEALIADQIDGPDYKLLMIEPDRLATPYTKENDDKMRSGVKVDESGRPVSYFIAKQHPGDYYDYVRMGEYQEISAENIVHLFRQDRPGQNRGAPWLAPSLIALNKLKRYTDAVIAAAETAASISATIETQSPDIAHGDADDDFDTIEVEKNTMMVLPAGHTAKQLKAEQPTATYQAFKHEILNEIARPLHMPFNVAALNSAGYNYASGRLDWQVYYKYLDTIRAWIANRFLRHVVQTWFKLSRLQPGYFSAIPFMDAAELSFTWFWPGTEHVDPAKEAQAQATRLQSMTTSLAAEYARQGKDWETELDQIAREHKKIEELGLKPQPAAAPNPNPANKPAEQKEDEDQDEPAEPDQEDAA